MTYQHKAGKCELVPWLVIFTIKYVETRRKSPRYFQLLCKSLLVSEKPTWANSVNTGWTTVFVLGTDGGQGVIHDGKDYVETQLAVVIICLYAHQRNHTVLAVVPSAVAQCQSLTLCDKQRTSESQQ